MQQRNYLSANPLVLLLWESEAWESAFDIGSIFRTHIPDMGMIFFELGDSGPRENSPFDLIFKDYALRVVPPNIGMIWQIYCHLAR